MSRFNDQSQTKRKVKNPNSFSVNEPRKHSVELFNALYRRVLCRQRVNEDQLTVTSLQALAKVYRRYHAEIGQFSDMSYILQLLDRVSSS